MRTADSQLRNILSFSRYVFSSSSSFAPLFFLPLLHYFSFVVRRGGEGRCDCLRVKKGRSRSRGEREEAEQITE